MDTAYKLVTFYENKLKIDVAKKDFEQEIEE